MEPQSSTEPWMRSFLSAYLGAYTSNGVYPETANSLKVTAGTGLNIAVQPGKCWVNGKFGYIDKAETLALNTAGDTDRTDSVVIRLDLINRTMEPVIKNNSTPPAKGQRHMGKSCWRK